MSQQPSPNQQTMPGSLRSIKKGESQCHFHGTLENNPLNLLHFSIFHSCSFSLNLASIMSLHIRASLPPSPNKPFCISLSINLPSYSPTLLGDLCLHPNILASIPLSTQTFLLNLSLKRCNGKCGLLQKFTCLRNF